MSDSKAKMLQIRFRLGLRPRPRLASLSALPDPLADLRGQLLKGGDGRGRVSPNPAPPQFQNPKTATGCYKVCCLVNRGTMGVNSLPKTVTRQRRDCDSNPCCSEPESGTLTTRLTSHPLPKSSTLYYLTQNRVYVGHVTAQRSLLREVCLSTDLSQTDSSSFVSS